MSRNARVLESLRASAKEGRLHHAYILSGPEAPAKMECAQRLASDFSPGDQGEAFGRVQRGNHPDFLLLSPKEGLVSVDDIRVLPKQLAYPPLESRRRVVVIEGAQCMNPQANNALLKVLEEPPSHTMFFLLCREPAELLPTIQSRCQVLRFAPLDPEELIATLGGRGEAEQAALVAWSDGSLSRAELLLKTDGAFALKDQAAEQILSLWEASPRIPSAAYQWVESVNSDEGSEIVIDTWALVLRDLAFTAAGAVPSALRLPQFSARLQALVRGNGPAVIDEAAAKSESINRFRVYRRFNGNLRLDFASLLAELQIISVGKPRAQE
jgi:DNA polymerase-3 subunit delta'